MDYWYIYSNHNRLLGFFFEGLDSHILQWFHEAAAGTLWLHLAEDFMVIHPKILQPHAWWCQLYGSDVLDVQESEVKCLTPLPSTMSLEVIWGN